MAGQLSRKTAAMRRESGRYEAELPGAQGRLDRPRRAGRVSHRRSGAARRRPIGADLGRDRRPGRPTGRRDRRAGRARPRPWARAPAGRAGRRHDGDGRARQLAAARQSDRLEGRAAAARGRADGQYGERHPKVLAVRAERDQLDARIRDEREALLRQFEGEVARARASERALADKLEELKGRAVRREADAERTPSSSARSS